MRIQDYAMLVYKHAETIEYVKKWPTFLRKIQISRVDNSRILSIRDAKFSGYCFYINQNM